MTGIVLGLLAAVSWGLTDTLAAVSSRRLGTLASAAFSLLVSVAVLGAGLVVSDQSAVASGGVIPAATFGVVATVANLALWQALRLAPLSVISPIAATVGVATVVLAMVLLGERPGAIQLAAVPIAGVGSLLAALVAGHANGRPSLVGGALLAFVAVLGYALVAVGLRDLVREAGWLLVAFVSRTTNASLTWLILAAVLVAVVLRARRPRRPGSPPIMLDERLLGDPRPRLRGAAPMAVAGLVVALGVADVSGLIFFAAGLEVAPAWLVGLVASVGPVLGIAVGLVAFGERLRAHQWLGIVLVGVALVLVAIGEAASPSGAG